MFFDERVIIAEDLIFLICLYNRASSIYILSKYLYIYRQNLNSAINKYYPDGLQKDLLYHRIFVETLKKENLYFENKSRYANNKICMYTVEISNLSRNLNLKASLKKMDILYSELKKKNLIGENVKFLNFAKFLYGCWNVNYTYRSFFHIR